MKDMIIKHFESSSHHNLNEGLTWYARAFNECLLLSQVFEIPIGKVVGVLASLSPNNKWQRNIHDTWKFLEKPHLNTKVCTFKGQRRKALNILSCIGTDESIKEILKGPKTCNFFENILHYNTSQLVTVDMWAYRSVNLEPTVKNFELTVNAYKEAATQLKLQPHQVQAVVWGVVRGKIA